MFSHTVSPSGPSASLIDNSIDSNIDGFEYTAAKIDALMARTNPDAVDGDIAVSERRSANDRIVHGKLSILPRLVSSGFAAALGRRRVISAVADATNVRQSKRIRLAHTSPSTHLHLPMSNVMDRRTNKSTAR